VRCGAVCSALAEDVLVVLLQRVEVAGWLWRARLGAVGTEERLQCQNTPCRR
jgi:hypothetical protein